MSLFSRRSANSTLEKAKSAMPANFEGLRMLDTKVEDVFVTRELGCQCGNDSGTVSATPVGGDFPRLDPVLFECSKCDSSVQFFDSSRDGYDGRLNGGASYEQGDQPQVTVCEGCGSYAATIVCGLAYNIDFEEDDQPELVAEAQDYFDAIDINARCVNCGAVRHIGAWELA